MKNKVRVALNAAAALFAAAAVICISVTAVVLFRPLYYFDINYLEIPMLSGMTEDVIRLNYDALIDYNLIGGPSELVFPAMKMSAEGRIHFEEVKDIFISMQIISAAAIVILFIFIFMTAKGRKTDLLWMRFTGAAVVSVAAVTGLAVLIDWNAAFTIMHKIFFRNDFWIFDAETDPVINILPEEFFFHCGIMIIIIAAVQTAVLQIFYRRLKRGRKQL